MVNMNISFVSQMKILSLGAESAGCFCFYHDGTIYTSPDFGDLLDFNNFRNFEKAIYAYIKRNKPDIILTDIHPLYNSTILGEELSKIIKIPHIKVQHHLAHIFSAIGDRFLQDTNYQLPANFYGIAMDGTGYGFDGNIWGGEVFQIENDNIKMKNENTKNRKQCFNMKRTGSLEEQTMIGGDLAVREPARMIIAILNSIKYRASGIKPMNADAKENKDAIYIYVKKNYTRNEFELLYNQLNQDFNCQKTTSTGRILDAVSVLLGFAGNKRNFKHEATKLLEKNSTVPYEDLELRIMNYESRHILSTTHLFEYLISNLHKDKKRLAATAQLYIATGLYEIIKLQSSSHKPQAIFAGGGMTNNRIISGYLTRKDVYISEKIPRGDEGLAFGQIIYCLLSQ